MKVSPMKVSRDGALIDETSAPAGAISGTVDGLLEIIPFRKGAPRRAEAHLARLRTGSILLDIPLNVSNARLLHWAGELIAANGLSEGALRLTLTCEAAGVRPTLLITTAPPPDFPEPARVIVAATRRDERSPLSRIKTLIDLESQKAREEVAAAGADDAILLNTHGRIAEGTASNIFLLVDGGLFTPPIEEGAMPGIARGEVVRLTRAEERLISPEMLAKASEVLLSNALGIRPVIAIDGKPVGDGEPGLITQLLATRI